MVTEDAVGYVKEREDDIPEIIKKVHKGLTKEKYNLFKEDHDFLERYVLVCVYCYLDYSEILVDNQNSTNLHLGVLYTRGGADYRLRRRVKEKMSLGRFGKTQGLRSGFERKGRSLDCGRRVKLRSLDLSLSRVEESSWFGESDSTDVDVLGRSCYKGKVKMPVLPYNSDMFKRPFSICIKEKTKKLIASIHRRKAKNRPKRVKKRKKKVKQLDFLTSPNQLEISKMLKNQTFSHISTKLLSTKLPSKKLN